VTPFPYGGRYRQIMVHVDQVKLEAHQMSVMDVVDSLNNSNLIFPAGEVRIGMKDYNIYANSQVPVVDRAASWNNSLSRRSKKPVLHGNVR